ncbi:hypothetical protein, partial [Geobacillus sp. ZGt-1]
MYTKWSEREARNMVDKPLLAIVVPCYNEE